MHQLTRCFMMAAALCAGTANAGAQDEVTPRDWDIVAGKLLAAIERGDESIVVLDDTLPPPAREALARLRRTAAIEELPQRDKFELPPGAYLRVGQFTLQRGRFEFTATTGVIPRHAGLNCGVTESFQVTRDGQGVWQAPVSTSIKVC